MTKRTTFMTRFLAMALALVLAVSNVMPGLALRASAEGPAQTAAELVAASYALTAEEAALLTSGYLKSEKYVYNHLSGREGLVTLDGNTVTAVPVDDYVPFSAELVVGDTSTPIELVNGVGTFNTEELVYSVVVTYQQTKTVSADVQDKLLNADEALKGGMDALKTGYAADTNLGVVVEALPVLKDLASGTFGAFEITPAAGTAIDALNAETAGNGGKLKLQTKNTAYEASVSKLQYVMESGAAYVAQAAETYGYLNAINTSNLLTNTNVDLTLEAMDELNGTTNAAKWGAFKGCLAALVADLEKVANADMDFLTADLLVENVDYAAVEALVNAITTSTPVTIQENLLVGYETVTVVSDNAQEVMVQVILERIENNEWVGGVGAFEFLTVAKGATAEEIAAAVEASGLEAKLVESIKANNPQYVVNFDHIVAGDGFLSEDGVFVIPYTPYFYNVTYSYAEPEFVPYGWTVTLPVHEDASKSYDYMVNGVAYAQGATVTVDGDLEITRTAGKAYRTDNLYAIVGANSGNDIVKAILESGALLGNKTISVRQPDIADSEMLTLVDNVLTAPDYDASYNGLYWAPYSLNGITGLFQSNKAAWSEVEGKVVYRLYLTGNDAAAIIELAKTLKNDAEDQTAALNRLLAYETDMATLNKTQLGAVKGSLDYTDLTPGDGTDMDAKCVELRAYFHEVIGNILSNNITGTNLTIYSMVTEYKNGGLNYYYNNAEAVRNEVVALSDNLTSLCGDPEKEAALAVLLSEFGKPEYIEKITMLGTAMAEVKAGLSLPNAKIDLTSANLGKLITAVSMVGELETNAVTVPYMDSNTLTAKDVSAVNVQVGVSVSGKDVDAAATPSVTRGTVLTAEVIAELKAAAEAIFVNYVGAEKAPYYTLTVDGGSLDALVGTALDQDLVLYYEYAPKAFTVKIVGEADQTISVEDLEVILPANTKPGYTYVYTIKGEEKDVRLNAVAYNFTVADLATLFANGSYEIAREENDEEKQNFENAFDTDINDIVYDAEGNIVGITANVDQSNLMAFAMEIVNSGYSYIEINDERFLFTNENNETKISVQTLINAMMNDAEFGSETLIALGKNNGGKLLTAKMNIRKTEDEKLFENIDFVLNMKSVPSQMVTVGNGLDAVKNYMSFKSNPELDQMDIFLNLPEAVYEVYLTALLATSTLDKTDVNAMNHAIAFNFLDDYLELLLADDNITAQTYENTLNMLIKEFNEIADKNVDFVDLAQYEAYYQMIRDAVNGDTVELIANEDDYTVDFAAKSEDINEALGIIGLNVPAQYINMVEEMKEGGIVTGTAVAYLEDAYEDYEAAMIVLDHDGTKSEIANNVYDFTSDLAATAAGLDHEAAIILLDDVNSDITISQSAIIDLNGKTINGNLNFTGRKLIIMDSSMNTVSGGGINGTISGDVVVLAGTYSADVSAFLRDGYYQENGAVRNALYYYENGAVVVDTDKLFDENYVEGYLPAVHYLAAEIALDFVLNYYTAASLTIEGNDIYAFNLDDIVGILGTDSNSGKVANLVDDLLAMIRFDGALPGGTGGIDEFINMLVADLLDLEGIYASVKNGTVVGDYAVTIGAWDVSVKHVADGDYVTAGLVTNTDRAKSTTLSVKFSGNNKDKTLRYIGELAEIVVEEETSFVLDLEQPYRDGNTLMLSGGLNAELSLDFSHNCDYNRMLAALVAFSSEELTKELVKDGCIMELNDMMSQITVGDFFTAIKTAVDNAEFDFAALAAKANVELTDSQLAKINEAYDKFQNGVGKVLAKVDLLENERTPLSDLIVNGTLHYDADVKEDSYDGYYRGYGAQVDLKDSFVSLKIKFAEKCDGLWGDANRDGRVNYKDAILILQWSTGRIAAEEKYDRIHLCVCDVNGDGNINYKDAVLVLQRATGRITKFPVEA